MWRSLFWGGGVKVRAQHLPVHPFDKWWEVVASDKRHGVLILWLTANCRICKDSSLAFPTRVLTLMKLKKKEGLHMKREVQLGTWKKIPQHLFRAEEKPLWTAGIWVSRTGTDSQSARSPAHNNEWSLRIRRISYMWLPLYHTGLSENKNKAVKLGSRWRTRRSRACSSSMFEWNNSFSFLSFC